MTIDIQEINEQVKVASEFVDNLRTEMGKVIVGQSYLIDRLLLGLLANGHILIEGVPGLAKSLSVQVLARAINTDRDLIRTSQERLREVEVIPDEKLEPRCRAHLNLGRAITRKVFTYSPPSGVHVAIIPPASDRVRTAGMYSTSVGEVYISLEMMGRARSMIDTLVHELAHHRQYRMTGEAEDLTPAHAESMTYIAAGVVKVIAGGELDDLLKEVVW